MSGVGFQHPVPVRDTLEFALPSKDVSIDQVDELGVGQCAVSELELGAGDERIRDDVEIGAQTGPVCEPAIVGQTEEGCGVEPDYGSIAAGCASVFGVPKAHEDRAAYRGGRRDCEPGFGHLGGGDVNELNEPAPCRGVGGHVESPCCCAAR